MHLREARYILVENPETLLQIASLIETRRSRESGDREPSEAA